MTFREYVDRAEHLIGAYRVGALTDGELLSALVAVDLQCDELADKRLDVLFARLDAADQESKEVL